MSNGYPRVRALAALLALVSGGVALVAGGLALPTEPRAQSAEAAAPAATAAQVRIDNFTFLPPTLTVTAGATVTWVNEDDIPHAVAAKDRSFRSKALDTDDRFSFTFTAAGEYDYFCSLHPHMVGKIIVRGSNAPP
jgi:plastocyanin